MLIYKPTRLSPGLELLDTKAATGVAMIANFPKKPLH